MEEVRLLEGKACLRAEGLWRKIFTEDTESFTAYYFKEKACHNTGFVLEEEEEIRAMLYLTPYETTVKGRRTSRQCGLYYIVGVATGEEYRHRGYMSRLLREALFYQYARKCPYTYLMPASPAIYEPFQFSYIHERAVWRLQPAFAKRSEPLLQGKQKELVIELASRSVLYAAEEARQRDWVEGCSLRIAQPQDEELSGLAAFIQGTMENGMQVFATRTVSYFRMLQKEMRSQNGGLYGIWAAGRPAGYMLLSGEAGRFEIQDAYILKEFEEVFLEKIRLEPSIMGRIVHLPSMMGLIESRHETTVFLKVTDPMLKENEGIYAWHMKSGGSCLERLEGEADPTGKPWLETSVQELAAFLFGVRSAKECFVFHVLNGWEKKELLRRLSDLALLKSKAINEIV